MKPSEVQSEFDRLKKAGDYNGLGWLFWHCFLLLPKRHPARKRASKLFHGLTEAEQQRCEEA